MKKKDRQRMLEKYMKCAAWGSAGILLTCFIRGHVIKENGTVRELKISFLEKEKRGYCRLCCRKYNDDTDLYIGKRPCRRSCRGRDTDSDEIVPDWNLSVSGKEDTIAEDSQTYAMILEKQANDEMPWMKMESSLRRGKVSRSRRW